MSTGIIDGRARAAHVRTLFSEALGLVEAGLAAGLPRGASLVFPPTVHPAVSPGGRALAEAVYKRGAVEAASGLPFPLPTPASLCAPCEAPGEAALLARFEHLALQRNTLFLVDAGMAALQPAWREACAKNPHVWLEDAEKTKTPSGLLDILSSAAGVDAPFHRIMAVGGGATSDLAGLVAGLLGLPFEVVPTTYLAAVDAGQGGKTGINVPPFGKNQLGLFHGADAFHLVPEVFGTLPTVERASGFGEALKTCFLFGRWPLSATEASTDALTMSASFVRWNMEAKARVVDADAREAHVRKLLNLGHTLGHAWEGLQEEGLVSAMPHGVCVALGMRTLLRAGLLNGAPATFEVALDALVQRFAPRARAPLAALEPAFLRLVAADKKNAKGDEVVLVTPRWGVLSDETLSSPAACRTLADASGDGAIFTRASPREVWRVFVAHGGVAT